VNAPLTSAESVLVHYGLFDAAIARLEDAFDNWGRTADPDCIPIVGPSRSGKSRLLEYFQERHPSVDHKTYLEKLFLLCDAPSRPTVKSMTERLLFSLGDPLWASGTTTVKTKRILTLLKKAKTRMLALDNFHHFVDTERERIQYDVADWLKEIFDDDDTHVSIVVAGLKRMNTVLLQNEQRKHIRFVDRALHPDSAGRIHWVHLRKDHREGDQRPQTAKCRLGLPSNCECARLMGLTLSASN
jgi:hypothetical protein